jgi:hypothetical protein
MAKNGRVLESNEEDRFLLLVGYSPNTMPHRGADGFLDVASPRAVEKACWRFLLNGGKAGTMHKAGGENAFRVVENGIYRNEIPWVIKSPDGPDQVIRQGDWVIGMILSKETWADYKAGLFGSGSLQGAAERMPATAETLERIRSAA